MLRPFLLGLCGVVFLALLSYFHLPSHPIPRLHSVVSLSFLDKLNSSSFSSLPMGKVIEESAVMFHSLSSLSASSSSLNDHESEETNQQSTLSDSLVFAFIYRFALDPFTEPTSDQTSESSSFRTEIDGDSSGNLLNGTYLLPKTKASQAPA
jgi:hypothetical protein